MKAPVPRPTLRLVDKVSRSCGHTPGKVAGQRAVDKAANPSKCLAALVLILERFFSHNEMGGKPF